MTADTASGLAPGFGEDSRTAERAASAGGFMSAYVAVWIITTVAVPAVVAVAAVATYVVRGNDEWAALVGLSVACGTWLLVPLFLSSSAGAGRANTREYGQLLERTSQLRSRLSAARRRPPASDSDRLPAWEAARDEAATLLAHVETELRSSGLRWMLSTGYVNLWNHLHRIDEALTMLEPVETLVDAALTDEERLRESAIHNRAALLEKLRRGVRTLSPSAARYLGAQPAAEPPTNDTTGHVAASGSASDPAADQRDKAQREAEARAALRSVRRALHEYRDERRDGMVRAKNRLLKAVLFTWLTADALLLLAMIKRVPEPAIIAAITFFLVGAVVGLFNRLRAESSADNAIEDYGLTTARLVHTPLFCGLAAVAGVVLVAVLPIAINRAVVTPESSAAGDRAAGQTVVPALKDTFNIETNPFGLIVAAVFGLTPSLLITRLHAETERYKAELRSTGAASRTDAPAGGPSAGTS